MGKAKWMLGMTFLISVLTCLYFFNQSLDGKPFMLRKFADTPVTSQRQLEKAQRGESHATPPTTPSSRLPPEQWKHFLPELFDHIPSNFSSDYRNPCWHDTSGDLRCIPYFYQIGSYKCGTTDLWDKLVQHPDVLDVAKEPHWWAWRRFGYTKLPLHKNLRLLRICRPIHRHVSVYVSTKNINSKVNIWQYVGKSLVKWERIGKADTSDCKQRMQIVST